MKPLLPFILLIFSAFACQRENHDIIFEDFEKGNLDKWEVQGSAFKGVCREDTVSDAALKESIIGDYCAWSNYDDDDLKQGKLISPEFVVGHKYIDFYIAGGDYYRRACINMLIDNEIVRTARGDGTKVLKKQTWDVEELIGKRAIIEVVDAMQATSGGLSYVIVDHIVFSNHTPQPDVLFEDFENGTFEHWNVEGEAFTAPSNRHNTYYPVTIYGFEGDYFAFSFGEDHDKKQGKLSSEDFTITHQFIHFLVGGGNHPEHTKVSLIVDGVEVRSSTGEDKGKLRRETWDVSQYVGQSAYIEIVDNYSSYWGHIIADDFVFSDASVYDENRERINYYEKKEFPILIVLLVLVFCVTLAVWSLRKKRGEKINLENKIDFRVRFTQMIEEEQIYLNPKLSIKELANELGMNSIEFEKEVEVHFKQSFNDIINEKRLVSFKEEILKEENKDFTLVGVAQKCGFSSKSSFYRIFKKHNGITPTEYLKSLGK